MTGDPAVPVLRQVVLDAGDARALAEFYRQLLQLNYRPGDEPPSAGVPDVHGSDWLVLCSHGVPVLAVQQVPALEPATWPTGPRPAQLHLDLTVPTMEALDAAHVRALGLGAVLLEDRAADLEEPLRVYADPAGHPFCLFVTPPSAADD